jgi:hypothetical protein
VVGDGVVRGVGVGDADGEGAAVAAGDDGPGAGAGVQEARAKADTAARRGKVLWVLSRSCWNGTINTMLPLH